MGSVASQTPCRSYVIKFVQSACFIMFGRSNHRKYQYDDGVVNVRPYLPPLASKVDRSVCISKT